ncbi:chromatin remodelling complex Rsc7/Swp82 subunit-domain-containing protein [Halteromyces radiatus]|uniref:chromatin remodelling complex Rsc7/Swp82 subunit-domain-containing protein n=1 Tax=Halteromyces radiatus TaxID=101107 RepID=UPI0022210DDA|nr:chromatin remodelling complex Rsc7/Swp82 subunit-domain-containing protein [Halteromyces radiatus]KAI8079726.1 chromatin remodelling complex Rsc7/Swp82 subunit-domain-containing protein [Halteromyces radiatus]
MPRGRIPKHRKQFISNKKETTSIADSDDSSLRRSSRKRRASTYQEDELLQQHSKKRKEVTQPPATPTEESDQESEIDEAGEKKIDKFGNLQDGRVFKTPTFTLPTRGDTVLMLAMDPAKALGFRDSHIFFNKNPTLERVRLDEEEKDILVERGMVLSWFRHRDVAVVTARSVFKRFGAKIIKKGKRCRDDYFEAKAREQGYTGETTTFEKKTELMALGHLDDSSFGLDHHYDDSFSHTRRSLLSNITNLDTTSEYAIYTPLTQETWLHHAALTARGFNAQIQSCRGRKPIFYDAHTNINQVPSATQPKACQWIDLETELSSQEQKSDTIIEFNNTLTGNKTTTIYHPRAHHQILTNHNDDDLKDILKTLPPHVQPIVTKLMKKPLYFDDESDNDKYPEYPIALVENQYQDTFPIHFTRFGIPRPHIQGPSVVIGNTQSLMAQQHYLNQVYQYVNLTKNLPPQNLNSAHPSSAMPSFMPMANIPPVTSGSRMNQNTILSTGLESSSNSSVTGQQQKEITKAASETKSTETTKLVHQCQECHQMKAPSILVQPKENEPPLCDVYSLFSCFKCEHKYHPVCANLTTPRQIAAAESYPWSCPECKICCICNSAGDETKLMICDGCDRGWHTDCCTPPVKDIPEGSWLCPVCAVCHSCDTINVVDVNDDLNSEDLIHAVAPPTTGHYKFPVYLASYCGPCFANFEEDRFCPACLRSYADGEDVADEDKEMVACDSCDRWIHSRCDSTLTPERYQQLCEDERVKYTCPLCADHGVKPIDPNSSLATLALQGFSAPCGLAVGIIGGKVRTRGLVEYNGYKVGVPEISGAGSTELPS